MSFSQIHLKERIAKFQPVVFSSTKHYLSASMGLILSRLSIAPNTISNLIKHVLRKIPKILIFIRENNKKTKISASLYDLTSLDRGSLQELIPSEKKILSLREPNLSRNPKKIKTSPAFYGKKISYCLIVFQLNKKTAAAFDGSVVLRVCYKTSVTPNVCLAGGGMREKNSRS